MIQLGSELQVLIYNHPVDMRKSIDGLSMLVVEALQLSPQAKTTLYLFRNRAGDKFKALLWEGNGFMLLYKRLEKGRFQFPQAIEQDYYKIDADLFNWLTRGFDFYRLKQHPELKTSAYY